MNSDLWPLSLELDNLPFVPEVGRVDTLCCDVDMVFVDVVGEGFEEDLNFVLVDVDIVVMMVGLSYFMDDDNLFP